MPIAAGRGCRLSAEQRIEIEQQLRTRGLLQNVSESELIELRRGVRPKHSPEDLNKEAREAREREGPWLVARTKPHREAEAKEVLKRAGFEVYLPKLKLIVGRKRYKTLERKRRKTSERKRFIYLFPKYIFVRLTENWNAVLKCEWISVIIRRPGPLPERGAKPVNMKKENRGRERIRREMKNRKRERKPDTMEDKEIKAWKAREQGGFICLKGFKEGQKVRAKAGPFADQIGTFIELVGDREIASFYCFGHQMQIPFPADVLVAEV